jgi:hypothetical protein
MRGSFVSMTCSMVLKSFKRLGMLGWLISKDPSGVRPNAINTSTRDHALLCSLSIFPLFHHCFLPFPVPISSHCGAPCRLAAVICVPASAETLSEIRRRSASEPVQARGHAEMIKKGRWKD